MGRVNVWLPDDLQQRLQELDGRINLSRLLQDAVRRVMSCDHEQLACALCDMPVDREEVRDQALSQFYRDLMAKLEQLLRARGARSTVEGAARVTKDVARRWQVSAADRVPLPRLPRAVREADDVVIDLRHP